MMKCSVKLPKRFSKVFCAFCVNHVNRYEVPNESK